MAGAGKGRVSNELVAASCAAVLAVYAAGYWRTRDAARSIEAQAQQRRPVRAESPTMPAPPAMADTIAVDTTAPSLPVEPLPAAPAATPDQPVLAMGPAAGQSSPAPAPEAAKPVPPRLEEARPAVAEPAAPPSAEVAAAQTGIAPESPKEAEARTEPYWRDGTFTGWGTSRHGDIKAQVVIRDGRIVESGIVSCETRYPCDVIETIIPQPVQFQSPEVDRVSRATESADAYYYALVNALAEALVEPALQAAAPK